MFLNFYKCKKNNYKLICYISEFQFHNDILNFKIWLIKYYRKLILKWYYKIQDESQQAIKVLTLINMSINNITARSNYNFGSFNLVYWFLQLTNNLNYRNIPMTLGYWFLQLTKSLNLLERSYNFVLLFPTTSQ